MSVVKLRVSPYVGLNQTVDIRVAQCLRIALGACYEIRLPRLTIEEAMSVSQLTFQRVGWIQAPRPRFVAACGFGGTSELGLYRFFQISPTNGRSNAIIVSAAQLYPGSSCSVAPAGGRTPG